MSDVEISFPWINYGGGDKEVQKKMTELLSEPWSPFNGCDMAQIFIFCMAYGFAHNKTPLPPPKGSASINPSAVKSEMRDLMRSLAIAKTGELKIIKDNTQMVKICQEYAFAAFDEIYNKLKKKDPSKSAEMVLEEMLNEIESKRNHNG